MKSNIKERLKSVEFISCTCDLWTHDYRCFLAMNAHNIDEKSGALVSDLLALKRMHYKDHAEVTTAIVGILDEYEIRNKIVSITTDNAGEFRCAFNKFSENFERFKEPYNGLEGIDLVEDNDDDFLLNVYMNQQEGIGNDVVRGPEVVENGANVMPMADDVSNTSRVFGGCSTTIVPAGTNKFVLLDLENICRSNHFCDEQQNSELDFPVTEPELPFPLPNRSICNPHTLNLIGKNDLFEALSREDFANQYFETFERVNLLWNTANKSNRNVEIIKQWIGKKIHKPHRLRWNRIYDSVSFFFKLKIVFLRYLSFIYI